VFSQSPISFSFLVDPIASDLSSFLLLFLALVSSSSLDNLLGGGLSTGELTEVAGDTSTGKTQLCMFASYRVASSSSSSSSPPNTVYYIDTANAFSPQRIQEMCKAEHPNFDPQQLQAGPSFLLPFLFLSVSHSSHSSNLLSFSQKREEEVLSRIQSRSVFDLFTLFSTLEAIEKELQEQNRPSSSSSSSSSTSSQFFKGLRLIVVDSLASTFSSLLGHPTAHAWMNTLSRMILKMANDHNIAFLVREATFSPLFLFTPSLPLFLFFLYFLTRYLFFLFLFFFRPPTTSQRIWVDANLVWVRLGLTYPILNSFSPNISSNPLLVQPLLVSVLLQNLLEGLVTGNHFPSSSLLLE
jgi:RecA/RadA recombinase